MSLMNPCCLNSWDPPGNQEPPQRPTKASPNMVSLYYIRAVSIIRGWGCYC